MENQIREVLMEMERFEYILEVEIIDFVDGLDMGDNKESSEGREGVRYNYQNFGLGDQVDSSIIF